MRAVRVAGFLLRNWGAVRWLWMHLSLSLFAVGCLMALLVGLAA